MVRKAIFSIEVDNYALKGRTLQIGAFPALPEASLDRMHICGWSRMDKNMAWKVSNLLSKGFLRVEVDNYALKGRTLQIGAFPERIEASLDRIHICGWSRMDKNMAWKVSILLSKGFSRVEVRKNTLKCVRRA